MKVLAPLLGLPLARFTYHTFVVKLEFVDADHLSTDHLSTDAPLMKFALATERMPWMFACISSFWVGRRQPVLEWFGSISASAYSLFQIMTLESWSMGIVRPVMNVYPHSWLFFLPFILVTTFTMLNLFIAVIVNAMQAETDQAAETRAKDSHDERVQMLQELKRINLRLDILSEALGPKNKR